MMKTIRNMLLGVLAGMLLHEIAVEAGIYRLLSFEAGIALGVAVPLIIYVIIAIFIAAKDSNSVSNQQLDPNSEAR